MMRGVARFTRKLPRVTRASAAPPPLLLLPVNEKKFLPLLTLNPPDVATVGLSSVRSENKQRFFFHVSREKFGHERSPLVEKAS